MLNLPHEVNEIQHYSVIFRVHKHARITEYGVIFKMERKKVQMCKKGWGDGCTGCHLTFLGISICYFEIDWTSVIWF